MYEPNVLCGISRWLKGYYCTTCSHRRQLNLATLAFLQVFEVAYLGQLQLLIALFLVE